MKPRTEAGRSEPTFNMPNAAGRLVACLRVLAASLLRQPLWWALLPTGVVLWAAVDQAFALGLTTAGLHRLSAAYELAFALGLAGAAVALGNSRCLDRALRPAGPAARLFATLLVALGSAAVVGACALVPAHLTRVWQPVAFHAEASGAALALGWLQFAVLASALGELPGLRTLETGGGVGVGGAGDARAATSAPLIAWTAVLVGPLALDSVWPSSALPSALFDVGAPLRASFDLLSWGAHQTASIWSTLFWGALGAALAAPRAFPRSPAQRSGSPPLG